jgi:signal peptidase
VLAHACVRASAVYVDRIWKFLMVLTHSESPVVVVLSGSMEPAFQRGDILFLWLGNSPFRVGEIVVFKIEGRDIPIVHRVIKVHEKRSMYYSD